ncbi:MAG: alpha/beta hydrolase [Clostridium sp.]|nr:alpha/beta hydrolase [Clostridium sp.]
MRFWILAATVICTFASTANAATWDKTFLQSDKVTHEKVAFYNRLGIRLVADMYMPKDIDLTQKSAAIIVGHPYGGVKEQTSGLYAQTMAERGFVTLAWDASYGGESGGQPRHIASHEAYVEDFSAAVDFIGTRPFVDRNRIGVIGICASGGFALSAAAIDPRMRAITTVSMYDTGRTRRQGVGDTLSIEDWRKTLEAVAEQRYLEFEGADTRFRVGTPETLPENANEVVRDYYDYYRTPRGMHPRSTTGITFNSTTPFMNFYATQLIDRISPRPILFIAGDRAYSRYLSEDAYAAAAEPKELVIIPDASHVDLYDRLDRIPFDKLDSFFQENLK